MEIQIVNKTPHDVVIIREGSSNRVFSPVGDPIRVREDVKTVGQIQGITITSTIYTEVDGTPPFKTGVYYIVSQMVKNALPHRRDFLTPKGVVKNKKGQVMGCTRLDN